MSEPEAKQSPIDDSVQNADTVSPASTTSTNADSTAVSTTATTKAVPSKIPSAHSGIPTIASAAASKSSGIKPPTATATATRIGRPCCQGHTVPKAGPPPLENKSKSLYKFY